VVACYILQSCRCTQILITEMHKVLHPQYEYRTTVCLSVPAPCSEGT
jgi:hypothetical protein